MEIGSIYEIDPRITADWSGELTEPFRLCEVEKYCKKHIRYTASGREAIALVLKSIEKTQPGLAKRCLLPAYMCDTVFFPFERAGWEMHFYHLDRKLQADLDKMDRLTAQVKPGLIFIHPYYGADTWKSARPVFSVWRKRGIRIMEDVTQSYYLESAGMEADYCVGSLRKWYAIPDGGFAASDEELPAEGLEPNREFARKRWELLTDKWEYLTGKPGTKEGRKLKEDYLRKNREMEDYLDAYAGISGISEKSLCILMQSDEKECRKRRMENCAYLHGRLTDGKQVIPVFGEEYGRRGGVGGGSGKSRDTQEAAPLYYPVYAIDRDELQKFLSGNDVYAPTLWPVGRANAGLLSEDEKYIYEHILALPIDQRYGIQEMERVAGLIKRYEKEKSAEEGRKKHRIGIRADANATVAAGHVMRCITIAKQLVLLGETVLFFTADEYASQMLNQAGMESVCLHTSWDHMEEETDLLRAKLQKTGCRKLLVDSYQVTAKYFERLKDVCELIYIDDCFEDVYPVNMIINYNAYHVRFPYGEKYEDKARLLLGTAYVPLREEFGSILYGESCRSDSQGDGDPGFSQGDGQGGSAETHVLLSSGGGDLCDALYGILQEVVQDEAFSHTVFHTVVGGFHRNIGRLKSLAGEHSNICLHEHVDHMAQLMGRCSAAVSAAGTMLFELSAMQVPTVFFVSADNQQYDSEFFAREGRMLFAGDIRKNRSECLGKICSQLKGLLADRDLQESMKKKLHEVTDGQGAKRIAQEIVRL